jgi:hypothetical protein
MGNVLINALQAFIKSSSENALVVEICSIISFCSESVFITSTCFGLLIDIDCGRTPIGVGLGAETTLAAATGSVVILGVTAMVFCKSALASVVSKGLSVATLIFKIGNGFSSISKLFFFHHSVDITE